MVWNKSHRPKAAEIMKCILGVSVKYPVITRWNSLFDALSQILQFKNKINDVCLKLDITSFSDNDFNYMEEYLKIQRPIAEAIDFLQRENNIYFGFLIPTLATIRNQLRALKNNGNFKILPRKLIELTEESLVRRFETYFDLSSNVDLAIIASALCPSVKMNWLGAFKPSITETETEIINKRIKNKIEAQISAESTEEAEPNPESQYFNFTFNGQYMHYFIFL